MEIKILASGSTGNCYRVSDGYTTLLLDAGIPLSQIMRGCEFKLSEISGCLITHEHKDHIKAAADLATMGIDIYASQGTLSAAGLTGHRFIPLTASHGTQIYTINTIPFQIEHDSAEPFGYYLVSNTTGERLLYMTDTAYSRYRFAGLTHIMVECNYSSEILKHNVYNGNIPEKLAPRIMRTHFSLEHLIDFLKANDLSELREIYLLHLSDGNSNAEQFEKEIRKVSPASVYIA